jgi:hypothetical protein
MVYFLPDIHVAGGQSPPAIRKAWFPAKRTSRFKLSEAKF